MFNFLKNIFSKPASPPAEPDPVGEVAQMVRDALKAGNRAKVRAIFYGLNSDKTMVIIDRLDAVERQQVLAAMGIK